MKRTYKIIKRNKRYNVGESVDLSTETAAVFKKSKMIAADDEGKEIEGLNYKEASGSNDDSDLKEKLKTSEEDKEELDSVVKELEGKVETLTSEKSKLETELESANSRVEALVKENKTLSKAK